ncbi:DnaD domain protein [Bacillus infantis]|uniref:DnaD domain protein n=1 Tax=Bacillus infantis TaxID=324767 RepID=UPI002FBE71C0
MSFVRTVKRENPFVQIDKDFIGNGKLSLKATGLLTYILSRPDGWQIRMKDIQKRFNDGETSVRSAMKELMTEGYVHRYQERSENGKFGEWMYDVYERPEYNAHFTPKRENHVPASPKRDFPNSVNPEPDNHVYSNNDFSNNDFSNKEEEEEEEVYSTFSLLISEINPAIKKKINEWIAILPKEIVKAEIENAALYNAKSWNYVESALIEDKKLGIKSLNELENKINNHKSCKKKASTGSKNAPTRKELLPGWYEEKVDYEPPKGATASAKDEEQKRKELEARLEKYKAK